MIKKIIIPIFIVIIGIFGYIGYVNTQETKKLEIDKIVYNETVFNILDSEINDNTLYIIKQKQLEAKTNYYKNVKYSHLINEITTYINNILYIKYTIDGVLPNNQDPLYKEDKINKIKNYKFSTFGYSFSNDKEGIFIVRLDEKYKKEIDALINNNKHIFSSIEKKAFKEREDIKIREVKRQKAELKRQREEYAITKRNDFLDNSLDIKVYLEGYEKNTLIFEYILFDDVWAHQFKKNLPFSELKDMGFKKVYIKDGYSYNIYWNL